MLSMKKNVMGLVASLVVSACGGSSDGPDGPEEFNGPGDQLPVSEQITADNFAVIASGIYAQNTVLLASLEFVPAISLVLLSLPPEGNVSSSECDVSGRSEIAIFRGGQSDSGVNVGDSVRFDDIACRGRDSAENGYSEVSVVGLEGEYGSRNNYQMQIMYENDTTISGDVVGENNGREISMYELLLAASQDGDVSYGAVNLHVLYDDRIPLNSHPFAGFINRSLMAPLSYEPQHNFTTVDFPEMAFEVIRDERNANEQFIYEWVVRSDYAGSEYVDHITSTTQPFIIEFREPEIFGEEPSQFAEGRWVIEFDSGEVIAVESSLEGDTTVTLDLEGDGIVESEVSMEWQVFAELFLNAIFTAIPNLQG